jgi:hypothetical protein
MIVVPIASASVTAVVLAQDLTNSLDAGSYWNQPLAPQGQPSKSWSKTEQSLAPADCGQCHAEQLAQWQTSRHAHAFSPGLVGQLLTFNAAETAECLQCHAPLAEQRSAFEAARAAGHAALREKQGLAAAGNSCGGCHLRQHRRFGPPQRGTGAIGASTLPAPHGGVFRTAVFESAEFCSACHQFSAAFAVNGKPLQNTYEEWRASPQATRGAVCQTCHMPDRQHLWRGIHDPEMVAAALTTRVTADSERVRFEITNSGVGHAFPSYVTPKVTMNAVALDQAGTPRPQTLQSWEIARRVRYDGNQWIELSDTRLLPGQSTAIEVAWDGSDRIRVWLEVVPDKFYATEVFPGFLQSLQPDSDAARLTAEAQAIALGSRFRLFETEMRRP